MTDGNWFPQRGRWLWWWVWGGLLALAWAAGLRVVPLALLALLCSLDVRCGWRLEEDGLREVLWLGRSRFYPWDQLTDLTLNEHGGRLFGDGRPLLIDDATHGVWVLLARLGERLQPTTGETAQPVDEAEVAQALGIARDATLVCRARPRWEVLALGVGLSLWPAVLASAGLPGAWVACAVLSGLGWWNATRERRRRAVAASVRGLEVRDGRRWRFVPWSAVRSCEVHLPPAKRYYPTEAKLREDRRIEVHTDLGNFEFYQADEHGPQLRAGLERLLDARRRGAILPTGEAIPAGAISVARLSGDEGDRGLTRVEPGAD